MTHPQPQIILASESPRRRELLAALGLPFSVHPAHQDEALSPGEPPEILALRLSHNKMVAVAGEAPDALVIAADTLVVLDEDVVLGKPASRREAWEMLKKLRGRTHRVVTGVALGVASADLMDQGIATTWVTMRKYSALEMRLYVASGDPLDKAGGYAIQNRGFAPVQSLDGCYANVVGLPLCHVYRTLTQWGVEARYPLEGCPWPRQHGDCPWAADILRELA